jgi:hypothetical protein
MGKMRNCLVRHFKIKKSVSLHLALENSTLSKCSKEVKFNAHVVLRGLYFIIWLHSCRELLKRIKSLVPRFFVHI